MTLSLCVSAPLHAVAQSLPLLGDTTSTQSLFMSATLKSLDDYRTVPTYPNYTLSSPYPEKLDVPYILGKPIYQARPMYPIVLDTTAWSTTRGPATNGVAGGGLDASMCAIHRKLNETADLTGFAGILDDSSRTDSFETSTNRATASFLQRPSGWLWDWLVQDLQPDGTNYTAWIVEPGDSPNRGALSGPISFVTKEGEFWHPVEHDDDVTK